jgi:hypothetical protein
MTTGDVLERHDSSVERFCTAERESGEVPPSRLALHGAN